MVIITRRYRIWFYAATVVAGSLYLCGLTDIGVSVADVAALHDATGGACFRCVDDGGVGCESSQSGCVGTTYWEYTGIIGHSKENAGPGQPGFVNVTEQNEEPCYVEWDCSIGDCEAPESTCGFQAEHDLRPTSCDVSIGCTG